MSAITQTSAATEAPSPHLATFVSAPFQAATWRAVGYDIAALPAGVVSFSIIVIGVSLGLSLAVTLIGIPLLMATLWLAGVGARVERWRAAWIGVDITSPEHPAAAWATWAGIRSRLANGSSWKQVVYFLLLLPVGVITFTLAVTGWAYAAAALTMPFWNWVVSKGSTQLLGYSVQRPIDYVPVAAAGVVAFFLSPWLCLGLARLQATLAAWLLS